MEYTSKLKYMYQKAKGKRHVRPILTIKLHNENT